MLHRVFMIYCVLFLHSVIIYFKWLCRKLHVAQFTIQIISLDHLKSDKDYKEALSPKGDLVEKVMFRPITEKV